MDIGILISGSSAFSKSSFNIWKFMVHILLKPGLENFEHYFAGMWDECNCVVVEYSFVLVIANTFFQQHKKRLYTWTSPDGQYHPQINYIPCSWRWSSSIQSANTRPGADYGSDHELLIATFRLKLKKVGKTTRPFRYNLIESLMIIQWKWKIDLGTRSDR